MNSFSWVNKKQLLRSLCVAPVLLMSVHAYAEDSTAQSTSATEAAAPVSPWSANVTLATRYVSRGFSNSWHYPTLQGGVDYVHESGFNIGTWVSTVSDKYIQGGTVEWDLYAGYTKAIGDVNVGAQLYYYIYPGAGYDAYNTIPAVSYNYGEIVPTLNYKWFTAKYWLTYTENYFGINGDSMGLAGRGNSRGSGYLDLNINYDLGNSYSLQAHYGHEEVKNFEFANWHDAKIGVTKSFDGGWSASLAATKGWSDYVSWKAYASVKNASEISNPLATTVVLSVTKLF